MINASQSSIKINPIYFTELPLVNVSDFMNNGLHGQVDMNRGNKRFKYLSVLWLEQTWTEKSQTEDKLLGKPKVSIFRYVFREGSILHKQMTGWISLGVTDAYAK